MDKPANAFAANAASPPPAAKAEPSRKYPGVGAKVQGRPGQSLEHLASRLHGTSK